MYVASQLASNLTARRHDVNVPDVPAELGALMKEVRKWMRRQQRVGDTYLTMLYGSWLTRPPCPAVCRGS